MTRYVDLAASEVQHVCVFGDPKTGKSTLVSKLAEAKDRRLLWFSFDNGHSVLSKLSKAAQERIEIVRIPDTKDNPLAIQFALKAVDNRPLLVCDTHGVINCIYCKRIEGSAWTTVDLGKIPNDTIVIWDNMSQLVESSINAITIREARSKKPPIEPDDVKFEFDEWRLLGSFMSKFLSAIQVAAYNTVVISHTIETEMEDGKHKLVPLAGTVNYSRNVGKYFDSIVYCEVKNRKHAFGSSTEYSISAITGSRMDVSIEKMAEPSLLPFFPLVAKEGTKQPEMTQVGGALEVVQALTVEHTIETVEIKATEEVVTAVPAKTALSDLRAKLRGLK